MEFSRDGEAKTDDGGVSSTNAPASEPKATATTVATVEAGVLEGKDAEANEPWVGAGPPPSSPSSDLSSDREKQFFAAQKARAKEKQIDVEQREGAKLAAMDADARAAYLAKKAEEQKHEDGYVDPGSGTRTTQEAGGRYDERVCICMWQEVNERIKLIYMDDLVDVLYRNMEEYAVSKKMTGTGTVASGELPFIVHFLSPGWYSSVPKLVQLSELLDYFCQVDMAKPEGEKLVVTKAHLFSMIADGKGRDAFVKMLKDELGWNGWSAKRAIEPFEGFIKFLEESPAAQEAMAVQIALKAKAFYLAGGESSDSDNDDQCDCEDDEECNCEY